MYETNARSEKNATNVMNATSANRVGQSSCSLHESASIPAFLEEDESCFLLVEYVQGQKWELLLRCWHLPVVLR